MFLLAVGSSDDFFLDREVISLGESLKGSTFIRDRIIWRGSNNVFLSLLLSNKQVRHEVEELLYNRFAFNAEGWGYIMKYSDPSKTPNRLPKHRLKHIVYTPHLTKYIRQHRETIRRMLSELPLLCDVRIMVTWQCAQGLLRNTNGNAETGTRHIVNVACLFRDVGKVAIVGQSLVGDHERKVVRDARDELKGEAWYWELQFEYRFFVCFLAGCVEEHL